MRREWNPDWPLIVAIAVFVVSILVAVTWYGFLAWAIVKVVQVVAG